MDFKMKIFLVFNFLSFLGFAKNNYDFINLIHLWY